MKMFVDILFELTGVTDLPGSRQTAAALCSQFRGAC